MKVPPQNIEAEKELLGSLLLNNAMLDNVAEIVKVEDFYQPHHAEIYKAIEHLVGKNIAADLLTVSDYLRTTGKLNEVGGVSYLAELSSVITAENAEYYAKIVKDKALQRKLIHLAAKTMEQAYQTAEVEKLIAETETELAQIFQTTSQDGLTHIGKFAMEQIEAIVSRKDRDIVSGIPTPIDKLNRMTTGLHEGELVIIAAQTGAGKTSFAMQTSGEAAIKHDKTVAIFTLEISKKLIFEKILVQWGNFDAHQLRTGKLDDSTLRRLMTVTGSILQKNLFIDDSAGLTLADIRSRCKKLKAKQGLDLVVVDYLQLVSGSKKESRTQEVTEISRGLKQLARDIQAPVIALSQFSRAAEGRTEKRPILKDLRESGSIEQDADLIIFIYIDDYEQKKRDGLMNLPQEVELIVAKQRWGPTGTVKAMWLPDRTKFANLEERL